MILAIAGVRREQLVVLSYDVSCPRRARRVRRILDTLHHAKQYSVYEAMLSQGEFNGVLAELTLCCDLSSDLVAAWWPVDGLRLAWQEQRLMVVARAGEPCSQPASLRPNLGNFMICYDISDPDALRAVAAEVAAETTMVQRSVYWLRSGTAQLTRLLERCASHLADGDLLWAYPLGGSRDLWRISASGSSVLPIATHRWRSS